MKMTLVCAMALLFLILWSAVLKGAEAPGVAQGKALFEKKCVLCHGPEGNGKGPASVSLNPKPADYTQKKFWEQPDIEKEIADTIESGKGQMPAFADLKPGEIQSIIMYMKQTFKPK